MAERPDGGTVEQELVEKPDSESSESIEQIIVAKHEAFLIECMKENLNHARHVENERMLFVSLFAALVGGVLAAASQLKDAGWIPCILTVILMLLNFLCTALVIRWNIVFAEHMRIAEEIYSQILSQHRTGFQLPANKYFCFNFQLNAKLKAPYLRARRLFIIYNCVVMALLVFVFYYFFRQAI